MLSMDAPRAAFAPRAARTACRRPETSRGATAGIGRASAPCSRRGLLLLLRLVRDAQAGCHSALDCELNGLCVRGSCECDPAWRGAHCGELALIPGAREQGYRPIIDGEVTGSWGGHAVHGSDGRYHLFATTISRGCNIDQWFVAASQ